MTLKQFKTPALSTEHQHLDGTEQKQQSWDKEQPLSSKKWGVTVKGMDYFSRNIQILR